MGKVYPTFRKFLDTMIRHIGGFRTLDHSAITYIPFDQHICK